jgi:serine/threonine protein kinase
VSESNERSLFESDGSPNPDDRYDTANLTGRQIGRYLIGRRLGSGGAAAVYQAYDQVQGRSVALKVLLPGADETTRSRFRQEARTAGALRHPNIVATLQVGDAPADGVAYIAMELIEGESLARLLERRGKLQAEESCNLLTPIALALALAHRSGVIHRDVKPSNILLRPASPGAAGSVQLEALDHPVIPLLADFGIARALDTPELTNVGRTIGTPAYMAPEQCAGSRDVNAQSDIYSLGAVLYRCVVGRAPFLGSTTQILYAHVYESVTIPDDILAALPPRVVDVLRSTLAKEPVERYASSLELADALTLAAGRSLPPIDAGQAEATSTLTLASLSAVGPAAPPQRTETVIVASARATASDTQSVAPRATPLSPVVLPSPPRVAPVVAPPQPVRSRWPRLVAGAVGILALVLVAVVLISAGSGSPFARLFPAQSGVTTTSQPLVLRSTATQSFIALVPTDTPVAPVQTVDPSAVAQETATPSPTATPVPPPPTATSTSRPRPSPRPTQPAVVVPTATPPLPTPTPEEEVAVACQYVAMEELYNYLLQPGKIEALGCATDQGRPVAFSVQPFQNGLMLRRDDIRAIYVRFAGNGQWEQHPDRWEPGMPPLPLDPELAPPSPGLFLPEEGIGQLWAENNVLRGTLGWATAPATVTDGVVQTFDGGLLVRDTQAEGEVIYEFLKSLFRF